MQKLRLFGMNGFFTLVLTCATLIGHGQQAGYLILIDADNNQPFIARIGDNQMASTQHGHLIIPQLEDSSYRVCIRFPRESVPEQIFPVRVNKKDHGFALRGADSSWVLYNWQSRETIRPLKELDSSRLLDQGVRREDGFSRLMAAVVNDTSVMYNSFAATGFSKDTVTARHPARDSAVALASAMKKPGSDSVKLKKTLVKAIAAQPEIKKLREISLKVSRKLVYLDTSPEGSRDTITLFVYFENEALAVKKPDEDPTVTARQLLADSASKKPGVKKPKEDPMVTARQLLADSASKKLAVKGKEKAVLTGRETVKVPAKDTVSDQEKTELITGAKDLRPAGGNCQQQANDPDVEALRSALLMANALQDKISVASGAFIMKCFSVNQLKVLVELFVSDQAKYRFLDAAHGHVSDPDHFHELADSMTDKAFVKKFRMLAQKRG